MTGEPMQNASQRGAQTLGESRGNTTVSLFKI
jgi:hypothetical protein